MLAPYLVVYGLSSLLLNHPSVASGGTEHTWTRQDVQVPEAAPDEVALALRMELDLVGRIWDVEPPGSTGEPFRFFLERPGRTYRIAWQPETGHAEVVEWDGGFTHILRTLHGRTHLPGSSLELPWVGYTYLSLLGLPFLVLSGIWLELPRWRVRPKLIGAFAGSSVIAVALMLWLGC